MYPKKRLINSGRIASGSLRVILIAQRIFRPIPLILRLILLFQSSILLNMRQCSMLMLLRSVRLKSLLILLMTIPTN